MSEKPEFSDAEVCQMAWDLAKQHSPYLREVKQDRYVDLSKLKKWSVAMRARVEDLKTVFSYIKQRDDEAWQHRFSFEHAEAADATELAKKQRALHVLVTDTFRNIKQCSILTEAPAPPELPFAADWQALKRITINKHEQAIEIAQGELEQLEKFELEQRAFVAAMINNFGLPPRPKGDN